MAKLLRSRLLRMSVFTPFAFPLCLALAASSAGTALARRGWPEFDHGSQSALFVVGLFGTTLFGRLVLDVVDVAGQAVALTLLFGLVLPVLLARRIEHSAGASQADSAFDHQGMAGMTGLACLATLALAVGLPEPLLESPRWLLSLLTAAPALLTMAVLRDGRGPQLQAA